MTVSDLPASRLWFLKTTGLFRDQSESILDWAGEESRERHFARGDSIPLEEDGARRIYVLIEGEVKLRSVTDGGKERILDVAGPGDTFGPLDAILSSESPREPDFASEAIALSNGTAMCYAVEEFKELVARRPAVVLNVTRLLGLKQRQFEIRLSRLLFRTSLGKVAGLLSELAERYGEHADDGITLNFRLTHQEMAAMIGVKRETVSECMAMLELDELIRRRKRHITVLKPEGLDGIV